MAEAGVGACFDGVILELMREPEHVIVEDDSLVKVSLVVMRGTCEGGTTMANMTIEEFYSTFIFTS
jgi:hypothetical protein